MADELLHFTWFRQEDNPVVQDVKDEDDEDEEDEEDDDDKNEGAQGYYFRTLLSHLHLSRVSWWCSSYSFVNCLVALLISAW